MCGRKTLTKGKLEIIEELLIDEWDDNPEYKPNYNIAPTDLNPVMFLNDNKRKVKMMRWGLIPSWAKDDKFAAKMINARVETLTEKPSFRSLINTNRCVIISDGFYEWMKTAGQKQPYYIKQPDHSLMPMAGLWSLWKNAQGNLINSYTIITTKANRQISFLHERMPVILTKKDIELWINCEDTNKNEALDLLHPYNKDLEIYPVSAKVNSIKYNEPACIENIAKNG
jgi:putative SOS response-associated peptidase YedK